MFQRRATSTLFPYTTLFRSAPERCRVRRSDRARLQGGDSATNVARRARRRHLRSEEHTSELQSLTNLVCRLLLEKKKAAPRLMYPRQKEQDLGVNHSTDQKH